MVLFRGSIPSSNNPQNAVPLGPWANLTFRPLDQVTPFFDEVPPNNDQQGSLYF